MKKSPIFYEKSPIFYEKSPVLYEKSLIFYQIRLEWFAYVCHGCFKLQVSFRKRATHYMALLRENDVCLEWFVNMVREYVS